MRFATLQVRGWPDYLAVDRQTGALGAWLNGCDDLGSSPRENQLFIVKNSYGASGDGVPLWEVYDTSDPCKKGQVGAQPIKEEDPLDAKFPSRLYKFERKPGKTCEYHGTNDAPGKMSCDGITGIRCYKDPAYGKRFACKDGYYEYRLMCDW